MKLYRIGVEEERVVAPSARQAVLSVSEDDHEQRAAQDVLTVWELAEPEATLHLTQADISTLIVALSEGGFPGRWPRALPLKTKLDGAVWQLAAQKTLLEKAQCQ